MPQITDIRPQKRKRPGGPRFNIFLEGKYSLSLPASVLLKSGLKIGQPLSEKEIEKLVKENEYDRYYNGVLKFICLRPRSEKEINNWFAKKGVGEETKKLVWQKLQDLGLINDEEFVKWWIEQRTTFRPMGKRAIEMELRQKGISHSLIAQFLNHSISPSSEVTLAKRAIEKKREYFKRMPPLEARRKMGSFLARRGFSWETVSEIVDKLSEERKEEF